MSIYHQPEDFGLKEIAELDYAYQSYSFHYRVVWQSIETGELFTADDAGCSCPVPFEEVASVEELDKVGAYRPFARMIVEEAGNYGMSKETVDAFLAKVKAAI